MTTRSVKRLGLAAVAAALALLAALLASDFERPNLRHSGERASLPQSIPPETADSVPTSRESVVDPVKSGWFVVALDRSNLKPIPGLTVRGGPNWPAIGATDEDGKLAINDSVSDVVLSGMSYVPASTAKPQAASTAEVLLEPGYVLRGTVQDQDGNPLADAIVDLAIRDAMNSSVDRSADLDAAGPGSTILCIRSIIGQPSYRLLRRTDSHGAFEFCGLPSGNHVLHCDLPGYVMKEAAGVATGMRVSVGVDRPKSLSIQLLRVYVGGLFLAGFDNWPATSIMQLTRRIYRAPDGLRLIAEDALGCQAGRVRDAMRQTGRAHLLFFCSAEPMSSLPDSVDGQCALDVFGNGRVTQSLRVVALDRFDAAGVKSAFSATDLVPRTLVVAARIPLVAMSLNPPGFGFEPSGTDDNYQIFILPDGDFELTAKVPLLLRRQRAHQVSIRGDRESPLTASGFDGVSFLRVVVEDSLGSPATVGSIMVKEQGGRGGELILTLAHAARMAIPCEAGSYLISLRDPSCNTIATSKVEVGEGAEHLCRIQFP